MQGAGREPAELVLKGGQFFDLVTGELRAGDIAISGGMIVGTQAPYSGTREIDISGQTVVPGFIDTHLHVESSLITPLEFDRCVLPCGVTTAICDPHEIANVLGEDGIRYFLESARHMVMDLRINLSSCVPATAMETSGASLDAKALLSFVHDPKVIGLAEFMNFPGVLAGDPICLEKLSAFADRHIDGHAPLLSGQNLNGYLSAGIRTDHEATTFVEAAEKLSKGMQILIREGSVSKDLHALIPLITERNSPFIAFCTDDRNPLDIAEEGHIDHMIRTAIAAGAPPLAVYRAASISAARIFRLHDRGLVAPGWRADLVILHDLNRCTISAVMSAGRMVEPGLFAKNQIPPVGRRSVKAKPCSALDFSVRGRSAEQSVIGVNAGKIITQHLKRRLPAANGVIDMDIAQDVIKVAVVERHGKNNNRATAFVHGFGLKQGAIASTVGHDSHNICIVGTDESDMAAAANRLIEIEGGFVVVNKGKVLAELALPIAGLISDLPFEQVRERLVNLRAAAKSLGTTLPEPFLQVAFLPLPVIPHLKLTDRGLFDVDKFAFVEQT
jgi:adenine deaminase